MVKKNQKPAAEDQKLKPKLFKDLKGLHQKAEQKVKEYVEILSDRLCVELKNKGENGMTVVYATDSEDPPYPYHICLELIDDMGTIDFDKANIILVDYLKPYKSEEKGKGKKGSKWGQTPAIDFLFFSSD